MNKYESMDTIRHYLQSHFVDHIVDYEEDGHERITMLYNAPKSPGYFIESCIYFFSECLECRVYYSEIGTEFVKNSNHQEELMRLLNFLNANVWISSSDGVGGALYNSEYLYTPRYYMTEEYDITFSTFIPYSLQELTTIQTADFLTGALPLLMDALSPPLFGVILGTLPFDQAVRYIKRNVLNDREITHIKKQ